MKKLFKSLLVLAAVAVVGSAAAQQEGTALTFEAISAGKGSVEGIWFQKGKDIFSLSSEQAASGTQSLKAKFIAAQSGPKGFNFKLPGRDSSYTLSKGTHTISFKLYVCDYAPKNLFISLPGDPGTTPGKAKVVLDDYPKNQWVDVSVDMDLSFDAVNKKITLFLGKSDVDLGAFYIDDFMVK
ncbi:MAG: hypothetical protein SNH88_04910 [Rikenellaceae bacterium]